MTDSEEQSKYDPPQGHYAMRLVTSRLRLTNDGDKPYIAVEFFIIEGESSWVDRTWRKRMYLTPNAEKYTKADLIRMGASQRALSDPERLPSEHLVFECDVVYSGRWANIKNITTRIELDPVPPAGRPDPEPDPQSEPGSPGFFDW